MIQFVHPSSTHHHTLCTQTVESYNYVSQGPINVLVSFQYKYQPTVTLPPVYNFAGRTNKVHVCKNVSYNRHSNTAKSSPAH